MEPQEEGSPYPGRLGRAAAAGTRMPAGIRSPFDGLRVSGEQCRPIRRRTYVPQYLAIRRRRHGESVDIARTPSLIPALAEASRAGMSVNYGELPPLKGYPLDSPGQTPWEIAMRCTVSLRGESPLLLLPALPQPRLRADRLRAGSRAFHVAASAARVCDGFLVAAPALGCGAAGALALSLACSARILSRRASFLRRSRLYRALSPEILPIVCLSLRSLS